MGVPKNIFFRYAHCVVFFNTFDIPWCLTKPRILFFCLDIAGPRWQASLVRRIFSRIRLGDSGTKAEKYKLVAVMCFSLETCLEMMGFCVFLQSYFFLIF